MSSPITSISQAHLKLTLFRFVSCQHQFVLLQRLQFIPNYLFVFSFLEFKLADMQKLTAVYILWNKKLLYLQFQLIKLRFNFSLSFVHHVALNRLEIHKSNSIMSLERAPP